MVWWWVGGGISRVMVVGGYREVSRCVVCQFSTMREASEEAPPAGGQS